MARRSPFRGPNLRCASGMEQTKADFRLTSLFQVDKLTSLFPVNKINELARS